MPHTLTGPLPRLFSGTEESDSAASQDAPFATKEPSSSSADAAAEPVLAEQTWSPAAPLPARFGDYELLGEIARGGMGVVYQARQLGLNRIVALKMILPHHLGADRGVKRFYREARAAAALDHPHIVPIFEVGEHQGYHFYTMTYVEGGCLKGLIRDKGLPTEQQAATLLLAVAEGVAFAHDHGIIHRDLKPENVLLDKRGRVRVADFGLAKHRTSDPSLTGAGQVMGTPSYMAPEQAEGLDDKIGPCSDVYGLGGILYFLLTGHAPFEGHSATQVLRQVFMGTPVSPRQYNPEASAELERICLKCLEKAPEQRYPSATALADALRPLAASGIQAAVSGTGIRPSLSEVSSDEQGTSLWATGQTTARKGPRWPRTLVVAVLFAGVLVGGGLMAVRWFGIGTRAAMDSSETAAAEELSAGKALQLPKPMRADFGLEVEMVGGRVGKHDTLLLTEQDLVRFRIKVAQKSYVGVWTIEADGTVLQLFPNANETDHLFQANQERTVPAIGARAVVSRGVDRVWIQASTKPWEPAAGERMGPLELFQQERKESRGLRLEDSMLSEQVLRYVVEPRR